MHALRRAIEKLGQKDNFSIFHEGDRVVMTDDAIYNYGEKYRDITLIVTNVATKYMPVKEFYAEGQPKGYHPGYKGYTLYELEIEETGEELPMSLYDWELEA